MNLDLYFRPSVLSLTPYSSARDDFQGEASVFLDANENPYNSPYNRYPDPHHRKLRKRIAELKNVPPESIFLGNGSDEAIDLLIRATCEPGVHSVLAIDPTYGMYAVAAAVNNVRYTGVLLKEDFSLDREKLLGAVTSQTRLLFLCSPNNPTANSFDPADIAYLVRNFQGQGLVVLDEAYIDFSRYPGFLGRLQDFENLVILQTFSKAWGLAGVRLGMAFANPDIIKILYKIKYPYNINVLTQELVIDFLSKPYLKDQWVEMILSERTILAQRLAGLPFVKMVYPSDANFLLVQVDETEKIYNWLCGQSVIVRNRSNVNLCSGCLRITVGTPEENQKLLDALSYYKK
ncbi:MAG TPA: histidinol-phosphate transaminase [Bacteroidales bacterium]|nr:histidinol-phosphate transaminase [Bacteroidales bacterium]HQK37025.1 histidinol-phosphate transaminase [Bacteroidales bacterium]